MSQFFPDWLSVNNTEGSRCVFSLHTYPAFVVSVLKLYAHPFCLVSSCVFTLRAPPAHCDESLNEKPNFSAVTAVFIAGGF